MNDVDYEGWDKIMPNVGGSIKIFNGLDCYGDLFAGGQSSIDLSSRGLHDNEVVVAAAVIVAKNSEVLERLDLRFVLKLI